MAETPNDGRPAVWRAADTETAGWTYRDTHATAYQPQISILGPRKALDFGELQQPGRRGTTRFFGTRSKVSMDLTASAIKPGRRSLNRTSMDVRRARGAIKDPSHAKSGDV